MKLGAKLKTYIQPVGARVRFRIVRGRALMLGVRKTDGVRKSRRPAHSPTTCTEPTGDDIHTQSGGLRQEQEVCVAGLHPRCASPTPGGSWDVFWPLSKIFPPPSTASSPRTAPGHRSPHLFACAPKASCTESTSGRSQTPRMASRSPCDTMSISPGAWGGCLANWCARALGLWLLNDRNLPSTSAPGYIVHLLALVLFLLLVVVILGLAGGQRVPTWTISASLSARFFLHFCRAARQRRRASF